jgi:hypothetical protein
MKVLKYLSVILLINTYLNILGTEKSQELKYISSLEFKYTLKDLPRLLAMHEFITVETEAVKNRMRCLVYNDPVQCQVIEESKCGFLDV